MILALTRSYYSAGEKMGASAMFGSGSVYHMARGIGRVPTTDERKADRTKDWLSALYIFIYYLSLSLSLLANMLMPVRCNGRKKSPSMPLVQQI